MRIVFLLVCSIVLASAPSQSSDSAIPADKKVIVERYRSVVPSSWGETLPGVITHFGTDKKCIALTFDACGSSKDSCDWRLLNFLIKQHIPATLFVSGRWMRAHPDDFARLAAEPLFEIENHGLNHKPCSINGRKAYGIEGTKDPGEVFDEIEINGRTIERLSGTKSMFYRSGTAYYDEMGIRIAHDIGYRIIGFNVLGDAGATFNHIQVQKAILSAHPGAIVILHMNHPNSGTAQGVIDAIPVLLAQGYCFRALKDCRLAE